MNNVQDYYANKEVQNVKERPAKLYQLTKHKSSNIIGRPKLYKLSLK